MQKIGLKLENARKNSDRTYDMPSIQSSGCQLKLNPLATDERLIDRFRNQGITIAEWALQRGYNPGLVYMIARGERKCLRGKSFQIVQEILAM